MLNAVEVNRVNYTHVIKRLSILVCLDEELDFNGHNACKYACGRQIKFEASECVA